MNESQESENLGGPRTAAEQLLHAAGVTQDGWEVRSIRRVDPGRVAILLGLEEGLGVRVDWIERPEADTDVYLRGRLYGAAYVGGRGVWDVDAADTPQAVKDRAFNACRALSQSLEGCGVAAARSAEEDAAKTVIQLEAQAVLQWLSLRLSVGGELADGWCLEQIYPRGSEELVVAFTRPDRDASPRLRLRLRDDDRPAFVRSATLDITYRGHASEQAQSGRKEVEVRLAEALVTVLRDLEVPGLTFSQRPGAGDVSAPTKSPATGRALNLAIPAPCGVRCSFCSVREEIEEVHAPTSIFVQSLRADIERAGADGVQILRINGIEPLNAPYLFDLLALARSHGFSEFTLHSTCLALAELSFAERFAAVMPERFSIYVPIYGPTAEVHDGVVGRPGTFDRLMKAVANIRSVLPGRGKIIFTTVLTVENVSYLASMRDLVRPLCDWWEVHLAFPNTSSATDRYRHIAISMSDALQAAYPKGWWPVADLPLGEVLPCVAYTHERATEHQLLTVERLNRRVREPAGTFYESAGYEHSLGRDAFTAATVPCPVRDACVLSVACPGKVYALYEAKYGLEELRPLSLAMIQELADGPALAEELGRLQGEVQG